MLEIEKFEDADGLISTSNITISKNIMFLKMKKL